MPNDQITAQDSETDWLEDAEELPPRPRRRLFTPASLALLGVLLTACGFIAGVLVEKGQSSSSSQGSGGNLAARLAAAGGGASSRGATRAGASLGAGALFAGRQGSVGGAGSAGRQLTVGQVSYVEGKTLYIESAEGNTVKVKTSAASNVSKTVTTSVKSIHPGESVVVQGSTDARTGTVTARTISVGAGGGGLGGAFGGGLRGLLGGAGAGGLGAGGPSGGGTGAGGPGAGAAGGSGEPALFGK